MNLKEVFKQFIESEKKFNFFVVDLLASEYGWPIEYIENLTLPEIAGLIIAIRERKDLRDMLDQINVAKGFSGQISSNLKPKVEQSKEDERKNLETLAKMLKLKVRRIDG